MGFHPNAPDVVGLWQLEDLTAEVGAPLVVRLGTELYSVADDNTSAAFAFNGVTALGNAASDPALLLLGEVTVQVLLFPNRLGSGSPTTYIIAGYTFGPADLEPDNTPWQISLSASNNARWVHEHDNGVDDIWDTGFTVPVGQWSHLAFTRDVAGTGLTFYFNGVERASTTLANAPTGGGNSRLTVGMHFNNDLRLPPSIMSSLLVANTERDAATILEAARQTLPPELQP
jgi:hypothetical protein